MKKIIFAILFLISLTPAHPDAFLALHTFCLELPIDNQLKIIDDIYIKNKQKYNIVYSDNTHNYTYPIDESQVDAVRKICAIIEDEARKIEIDKNNTFLQIKNDRYVVSKKLIKLEAFFYKLQTLLSKKYGIRIAPTRGNLSVIDSFQS